MAGEKERANVRWKRESLDRNRVGILQPWLTAKGFWGTGASKKVLNNVVIVVDHGLLHGLLQCKNRGLRNVWVLWWMVCTMEGLPSTFIVPERGLVEWVGFTDIIENVHEVAYPCLEFNVVPDIGFFNEVNQIVDLVREVIVTLLEYEMCSCSNFMYTPEFANVFVLLRAVA